MHTPFTDHQNPHSALGELRETEPVTRIATPDGPPAWLVTRHADVHQALLDDAHFSLAPKHASGHDYLGFQLPRELSVHLLATDPPRHTELRKHIAPSFTAARVRDLAPTINGHAHQLVDALDANQPVDLVADIAIPMPIALVTDLLPLPGNTKSALTTWATRMLLPTPGTQPRARDTLAEMREIIREATRSPAPGGSLMAHLLEAHHRARITTDELTSMIFYVLFVWLEPFVDAIGSTLLRVLTSDHREQICARPALRDRAVEETLRYDSPQLLAAPRFARQDTKIAGVSIPAGDTVLLALAAANRDPRIIDNPDQIDLTRAASPHLSLGHGIHVCPAAALTRHTLCSVVTALLKTFPDSRLARPPETISWRGGFRHRGPATLPILPRARRS
jgi:cytochrome P450